MNAIANIYKAEIQDGICTGACILSGHPGTGPDFLYEAGSADCAGKNPMTQNTVIDIASCTKVAGIITSLLIAHSRGLFDPDAPFTEYLPQYTGKLFRPLTVRELANHLSGFMDVPGEPVRRYFDESGKKMLENVMRLPPPFPPTDHAVYACWNYILLCKVLENIVKMPFPDFAAQNIFRPLKMDSTSIGAPGKGTEPFRLAQTTGTPAPGVISDFVAYRIFRDGGTTGNAGMFSTAADLAKLMKVYLRHGEGLFGEKSFQLIAPDTKSHTDGYRRFGWVIWDDHQHEDSFGHSLLHSGWSGQTIYMNFKTDRYVLVLTARQGDYERSKTDRFTAISILDQK